MSLKFKCFNHILSLFQAFSKLRPGAAGKTARNKQSAVFVFSSAVFRAAPQLPERLEEAITSSKGNSYLKINYYLNFQYSYLPLLAWSPN